VLEKKHHEFREKIRAFALEKIEPNAAQLDLDQRFPTEYLEPLAEMGMMSMIIPEQFGGQPIDTISYSIAVEELSRVCGSTGITIAAHNSLGTFPIAKFGSDAQKEKFLPRAAKGSLLAFGLTEPDAGSDAGGTRTMALKDGDGWIVNGSKCFITSATHAIATICTAKTSDDPKDPTITCFVLGPDDKGYEIGKHENKIGLRGSDTASILLDDVKATEDHLLGKIGDGFRQMLITLDGGRISIGAMALGLAQGALDCALKYATTHQRDGKPVGYRQGVQFTLADMATEIQAARLMIYEASAMKDAGVRFSQQSAMCKVYASEVGRRAAERALDILCEAGMYTGPLPAERIWREVKLCEIGEGTSEIQRLVIGRALLKAAEKA
jgi:alkylation response protein AidB-like acyl-CoA dehydrogenase